MLYSCRVPASHRSGSSAAERAGRLKQLRLPGPGAQAQELWRRAQLLHVRWDLPGPGIEGVSPALQS